MKKIGTLSVLLMLSAVMFAQNTPKTVQINYKNYEVLPYDLDGTYDWYEAKEARDKLMALGKSDWFLPDKNELEGL